MQLSMIFLVVAGVLIVLLALAVAVLLSKQSGYRQSLLQSSERSEAEIARLTADLSEWRERCDAEMQEKADMKTEIVRISSRAEAEARAANEKIALLQQLRDDLESKFKNMASEVLQKQGEQFSKANIERLEATLTPLREHVSKFETELKEINKETIKEREVLKEEVQQLSRRSHEISEEALALTRALKGDTQMQGAWGERILENILQKSGLREGEEYEIQAKRMDSEGNRLRPDVVVKMPNDNTLIIDSKVSLLAYSEAVNAEEEELAQAARKRHVASIKAHIKNLSDKNYVDAEKASMNYVVMFVPIEGALSEALREEGMLAEQALEKNITIATPTTLMLALRTVAHIWSAERRNLNAEKIATEAGRIYDKVANFLESMDKVGNALTSAENHYQAARKQLDTGRGNVLSKTQKLKDLGAKTQKSITADYDDTPAQYDLTSDEQSRILLPPRG